MKKAFVFLGFLFFLFSCRQETAPVKPVSSPNRILLEKKYNEIYGFIQFGQLDSLEANLKAMDSLSANEPPEYKAMASIGYGVLYANKASYELALKHYEKAIRLIGNSRKDTLLARAYSGVGNYYKNTGDYPKAMSYLFQALKIYESYRNLYGVSMMNANIAQVYMQKNDMDQAKEHLKIAMKTFEHQKWRYPYLNSAHTLANIYGMGGDYKSAMKIDEEGIRIADSLRSPKIKVTFLDNKANCFLYSHRLDSARFYFNECLKIDQETGDGKQLADTYSNLGQLEAFEKNYARAEEHTMQSIRMLEKIDSQVNMLKSYEILTGIYRGWGKPEKALEAKDQYMQVYKKMMNEKAEASLAEFKIVHETEKKEKIIAQNRIELLEKEREVKQRNSLLIGISLLAFFIAVTGYLIYRQQKLKNSQQAQEHELKTAIAQIETQNKLQEQRLTISRDLHDNIGAQLTFIISSVDNIKYAFDLKNTKLDEKLQSINNFTKATIIELRDTIWAMNNAKITLEDLRGRIFNFIEKAKDAREEIDFRFHIDEDLRQLRLTTLTGMNIYRTIQEAINNAIKYSQADVVSVSIRNSENRIRIGVDDNGVGFDPEMTEKGNGLVNMQKRIEDIGGKFILESETGKGTSVTIWLSPDFNT